MSTYSCMHMHTKTCIFIISIATYFYRQKYKHMHTYVSLPVHHPTSSLFLSLNQRKDPHVFFSVSYQQYHNPGPLKYYFISQGKIALLDILHGLDKNSNCSKLACTFLSGTHDKPQNNGFIAQHYTPLHHLYYSNTLMLVSYPFSHCLEILRSSIFPLNYLCHIFGFLGNEQNTF